MEFINTIREALKGYKTYAIAATVFGLAVYNWYTGLPVNDWVWPGLGALGITASRASVARIAQDIAAVNDAYNVIMDLLKNGDTNEGK
jgi:hypothetical protein